MGNRTVEDNPYMEAAGYFLGARMGRPLTIAEKMGLARPSRHPMGGWSDPGGALSTPFHLGTGTTAARPSALSPSVDGAGVPGAGAVGGVGGPPPPAPRDPSAYTTPLPPRSVDGGPPPAPDVIPGTDTFYGLSPALKFPYTGSSFANEAPGFDFDSEEGDVTQLFNTGPDGSGPGEELPFSPIHNPYGDDSGESYYDNGGKATSSTLFSNEQTFIADEDLNEVVNIKKMAFSPMTSFTDKSKLTKDGLNALHFVNAMSIPFSAAVQKDAKQSSPNQPALSTNDVDTAATMVKTYLHAEKEKMRADTKLPKSVKNYLTTMNRLMKRSVLGWQKYLSLAGSGGDGDGDGKGKEKETGGIGGGGGEEVADENDFNVEFALQIDRAVGQLQSLSKANKNLARHLLDQTLHGYVDTFLKSPMGRKTLSPADGAIIFNTLQYYTSEAA